MLELSDFQIAVLERLRAHGFTFIAFPLYASRIGVRKGNCAALLDPVTGGGLRVFGEPSYLLNGNLSVVIGEGDARVFVWKKDRLPATEERLEELRRFASELSDLLAPRA